MKAFFYSILLLCATGPLFAETGKGPDDRSWKVLVTIAPHKVFIEEIAGDIVKVQVLIPAGVSAHSYDPSPKQTLAASQADLWFTIGEPFEQKALTALRSHNPRLKAVDMKKGLDLISHQPGIGEAFGCCGAPGGVDLHYWLSPILAQDQAQTMADALMAQYPEKSPQIRERANRFIEKLKELDHNLAVLLNPMSGQTILVSHPAYAYFCRDYNLHQLSIEFEGKDPTPQQLTKLLDKARTLRVKKVFIQPQFPNKGAKLIAKELNAVTFQMDPYSEDYFENLKQFAEEIARKR